MEESGEDTEAYNDNADGQNVNSDLNEPVSIIFFLNHSEHS